MALMTQTILPCGSMLDRLFDDTGQMFGQQLHVQGVWQQTRKTLMNSHQMPIGNAHGDQYCVLYTPGMSGWHPIEVSVNMAVCMGLAVPHSLLAQKVSMHPFKDTCSDLDRFL